LAKKRKGKKKEGSVERFMKDREGLNEIVMKYAGLPIKRFYSLDTQVYRKGALGHRPCRWRFHNGPEPETGTEGLGRARGPIKGHLLPASFPLILRAGHSANTFVSSGIEQVTHALPPTTTLLPTIVSPPRMVAPE